MLYCITWHDGGNLVKTIVTKKSVVRGIGQAVGAGSEVDLAKIRKPISKMMHGFPKSA
jgi:hypothetical protein